MHTTLSLFFAVSNFLTLASPIFSLTPPLLLSRTLLPRLLKNRLPKIIPRRASVEPRPPTIRARRRRLRSRTRRLFASQSGLRQHTGIDRTGPLRPMRKLLGDRRRRIREVRGWLVGWIDATGRPRPVECPWGGGRRRVRVSGWVEGLILLLALLERGFGRGLGEVLSEGD